MALLLNTAAPQPMSHGSCDPAKSSPGIGTLTSDADRDLSYLCMRRFRVSWEGILKPQFQSDPLSSAPAAGCRAYGVWVRVSYSVVCNC